MKRRAYETPRAYISSAIRVQYKVTIESHVVPRRWRAASNNAMEPATPALSDSTEERIGIEIVPSAALRTSFGSPVPSLPIKIATASRRTGLSEVAEADVPTESSPPTRPVAAMIFTRAIFSCASKTGTAIPRSTGRRSADPADARKALGDQGSAVPRVAIAPVAP